MLVPTIELETEIIVYKDVAFPAFAIEDFLIDLIRLCFSFLDTDYFNIF